MPRLNGTGPWWGGGPGAGWGMGSCGAGTRRGYCRYYGGYGLEFGRFFSPKNELAALEDEEKILEEELATIKEEKAALKNRKK